MCLFVLCCRGFAGAWPGKGAHDQAEGRTVCFETRRRGADKIQVLSAKLLSESAYTLCPNPRPCPLGSCEVRGAQVQNWDLSFFELVNVAENRIVDPSLKRLNVGVRGGGLGLCRLRPWITLGNLDLGTVSGIFGDNCGSLPLWTDTQGTEGKL